MIRAASHLKVRFIQQSPFLTLMYCATRVKIVLGYPDYHALMACLATALLIWVGIPANSIVSRLLSLPPLVILGRLSYSLYLWHWPIFAVGRYLGFKENLVFTITCYTLTLLLSCISYFFIEKPCRKKSNSLPTSFSILVLISIIIFVALYSLTERYNGFSGRFGADYLRITSTLDKYESPYRESCLNDNEDGKNNDCIIGDTDALKKALLIGDSHSNHFWNFIDLLAKDAHVSVMVQGTSTCLVLPGISQFDWRRGFVE
ncbi:acyltransferase family protein [Candidatus Sodalis pierantonius]|uniref:acyltransferase family protein n=1 Tax=Candidatus Sodalis pierantonii TaxID=1486991 RepID=UPI00130DA82E|nr:acyltransferase [Candidatus Sodalis pierantonius]